MEDEWKGLASGSDHPWLSEFEDNEVMFDEYKFREENPLSEHPNALEEGQKKLEQGRCLQGTL